MPVTSAIEAVVGGAPRELRDRVHAGQSDKRSLGTHPAAMGPSGERDGSSHGTDSLEQWSELAGADELAHAGQPRSAAEHQQRRRPTLLTSPMKNRG